MRPGALRARAGQLANENAWRGTYDNNTPMHFGVYMPNSPDPQPSWVPAMQLYFYTHDYDQYGTGSLQIVYLNVDLVTHYVAVVYTFNQSYNFGRMK